MIYDPKIDLVNDNVYTKFGLNRFIRFQDIEQKLNSDDDPRGVANLDPRGLIGRIYVDYHLSLLHTKYTSFRQCGFREERFFKCFSHYKPMADNDAPGAWPIRIPGTLLAGIIKGLTKHCFTQNIKALGLMVTEKKIFRCFPIISLRRPMTPGAWPTLAPGAWLAGFIKGTTKRFYILNI